MEQIISDKTKVDYYSDIEETAIQRYSKFNKYMILNDEVGSSFSDVDKHFSRLYTLINEPAKLKTQIDNFRQLLFSVANEQSFENMAFACLVKSVNGEKRDDLTKPGLERTLELIKDLKTKDVKKKSWNFPKMLMKNLKNLHPKYLMMRPLTSITRIYDNEQ